MKLTTKTLRCALSEYVVGPQIGAGGGGTVFSATRDDGVAVAVKILKTSHSKEKLKRFRNELAFCQKNTEPRLITVLESGIAETSDGLAPFYVMPRYKGTLRQRIDAGVSPEQAQVLGIALLDAVEAAHLLKVVHRDIKPENLLWNGNDRELVLTDFGAAHFHEDDLLTSVETAPGTRLANFEYAAPEQRRRGAVVDRRADLYAVGLVLHELFTRVVPHGTGYVTVSSMAPAYGHIDDIVTWLIQHSPDARPDSVDAVRLRLRALEKEAGVRLRLSAMERTIVPADTLDDPLVTNPPQVVGVDFRNNALHLQLSAPVTTKWISSFQNCNFGSAMMGSGPQDFVFADRSATLGFRYSSPTPESVQRAVEDFKRFVGITTREYSAVVARERRQALDAQEREAARALAEERKRLDILKNLRL